MNFIACDLETTGLDPVNDKIIEIAMVKVVDGQITDTFSTLVNPKCKIPLKIKRLTGITDEQLAASPTMDQVTPLVFDFMEQCPLLGHNINFDHSFLSAKIGHLPFTQCIDTLEMARLIMPAVPGYSLSNLVQSLQLAQKPLHRALDDALAATALYFALLDMAKNLKLDVLLQLLPLLQHGNSPLAPIVESIIKDKIKTMPGERIKGIPIKEPIYAGYSAKEDIPDIHDQTQYQLDYLLGPRSPLGRLMPNYQFRKEQIKMAGVVAETLTKQKILLVEAGTGTGKSIAYLLPALLWALQHEQRAIIATNTINLQEQIWHKDIPLLRSLLELPFQAALLKGRSNYICLRRFINFITHAAGITASEAMLVARILVWLQHTDSGDKSELNLFGPDNETWMQLCSESDTCLGNACRWCNQYCFVTRARRNAENAHLVIINHSLLFADIVSEVNILPNHGALVMDEAHNIEETAAKHMGKKVSRSQILQWLTITGKNIKKLNELAPPQDGRRWLETIKKVEETRHMLITNINSFFYLFIQTIHKYNHNQGHYQIKVRLHRETELMDEFEAEYQNLLYRMRDFIVKLRNLADWLEIWTVTNNAWEDKLQDIIISITSGNDYLANLDFILKSPEENYVCWVEAPNLSVLERESYQCTLHATPIDISAILHEKLFNKPKAIILTSATLTVNKKFDHFIKQCGLNRLPDSAIQQIIADSPFNYDQQCLLCVARDFPNIGEISAGDYLTTLINTIYELSVATGGRTLVLFTSHKLLRDTYHKIKPLLDEVDICVLGQSIDGGRTKLVNEFHQNQRSVLFGAFSFWEGIDIPGDALVNVIIVKLPFAPPDDPVLEARNERIAALGQNSFYGLSLPNAVIRFKQGFGRLIRSEQDRGAVVVLDKRIIEKRYGKIFLNSLPVKSHLRGNINEITQKLTVWLG
ncbi:DnaQ family exonuclease/DinG family helicase, putative [Desulfoscipio gibsoniae DSM 7213]|uniref:3'-5' exonuclease DinG n=1 Tax=Desulfoscipio gibsoniae DSM 7213 TaxID=767817 RepID=R4KLL6_9FIRM|nr:DnaQ family exonuclease/DinG family helicase, putative [Desulfoscipio gibsoniae DSM 7213]